MMNWWSASLYAEIYLFRNQKCTLQSVLANVMWFLSALMVNRRLKIVSLTKRWCLATHASFPVKVCFHQIEICCAIHFFFFEIGIVIAFRLSKITKTRWRPHKIEHFFWTKRERERERTKYETWLWIEYEFLIGRGFADSMSLWEIWDIWKMGRKSTEEKVDWHRSLLTGETANQSDMNFHSSQQIFLHLRANNS